MRILVVDDDHTNCLLLSTLLSNLGHEAVVAGDGAEAWEILQRDPISLVISDWMMPNMDGVELCRRIRAANSPHYTYLILLTAKTEMEDLITGMKAGADDFLIKPYDVGELAARLRAGVRVVNLEQRLADQNARLSHAYRKISKDLNAAAELQRHLLPDSSTTIAGLDLSWLFLPCKIIAGDTFNYFRISDTEVGFYLLDVAGHGIPSAMQSFSLHNLLTVSASSPLLRDADEASPRRARAPRDVMNELNQRFHDDDDAMQYFTMIYGVFDMQRNRGRFCQAGHPPPIHQQQGDVTFVGDGGYPIAMLSGAEYTEHDFELQPGERLILYSDGVTECVGPQGSFSGDRLEHLIARCGDLPLPAMVEEVERTLKAWRGQPHFDDDVSLLALERC